MYAWLKKHKKTIISQTPVHEADDAFQDYYSFVCELFYEIMHTRPWPCTICYCKAHADP